MTSSPLFLLGLLCLGMVAWPALGDGEPIGTFRENAEGLTFTGDGWRIQSHGERGFTSLRIGDAEFFHATDGRGALAIQNGQRWVTKFPDRSTLSHDQSAGRLGAVSDGVNMIRVSPDWTRPAFELYFGANEKADQSVCLFLSDDVAFVRGGNAVDTNRATLAMFDRNTKTPRPARELLVVHRNGTAFSIRRTPSAGPVDAGEAGKTPDMLCGVVDDPEGNKRLAVIFPVKGFAANSYTVTLDPVRRGANFAISPVFDVISSDDPPQNLGGGGAANGVKNPIYGPRTTFDFGITFGYRKPEGFDGYAELEIVHSLGQPHFHQRVDLKSAKPEPAGDKPGERIRVKFDPKFHLPGVSEVHARLFDADNRLIWTDRYRMAWDWENYKPASDLPEDFEKFWSDTLETLRSTPLEPETTRVKAFEDHPQFEIYHVRMNGWNKQRLHAMLFVPKGKTLPLPGLITAHPGTRGFALNKGADGVYGSAIKHDPRFVTIVPLIRGHAPDDPDVAFNHPWWGPLDHRDTYVARSWFCAMARAVDYLATRGDLVDPTRLVASGGSQGGALAIVTAALDPRIAYCFADCPSNAQPREIMFNYPSFGPSRGQTPDGKTADDVARLLSYYNPANFARMIRCPTYVGSNIGDVTVHSMGPLAVYHNLVNVPAEKKAFYPGFSHFHGSGPGLAAKRNEIFTTLGGPAPEKPKRGGK